MKSLKKVLPYLLILLSPATFAFTLDAERGITLEVLNEKKVSKTEDAGFVVGDNQLVVTFTGRLKKVAKPEFFASKPYVIRLELNANDKLELALVSNRYEVIESLQEKGEPIFTLKRNGSDAVSYKQYRLEPDEGLMPYSDLPKLVIQQNRKEGIYFDSAVALGGSIETLSEAESQLKTWYLRASKEERKAFRKWMVDQE
ncbi:DUF2057 family protein [Vibrio metoecus]|uniref:DUF2057 domain-containing protein n=1 Tax=Vibrio metoecus TaxID=1481663 RepID=A0A0Q0PK17_VIBMT|nr:DUF2057 family protein [Vibrio metoecus]EEX66853.1 hypothetical protein VCJ_000749 [Vibrio metoecus]KQA22217.1 hypothetical protein AAY54_00375 [Vibrio metoecus]KQA23320.1 hypothetical protein AAY55_11270 [Vibrio metoecus]KQA99621.1 hypothetical protein XV92_12580 [Vibrio metoecus]WKY94069.1 DUF2057 family protein [Vibrio metoecus]